VPAPRKYPPELRERAQRLVREAREQEPDLSLNAAVTRIGQRVGVKPDTLRGWVKQADIDDGTRPGTTTADAAAIRELQAEVRELRRANETSHASGVSSGLGLWAGKARVSLYGVPVVRQWCRQPRRRLNRCRCAAACWSPAARRRS